MLFVQLTRHDNEKIFVNMARVVQMTQEATRTVLLTDAPGQEYHMISVKEKAADIVRQASQRTFETPAPGRW